MSDCSNIRDSDIRRSGLLELSILLHGKMMVCNGKKFPFPNSPPVQCPVVGTSNVLTFVVLRKISCLSFLVLITYMQIRVLPTVYTICQIKSSCYFLLSLVHTAIQIDDSVTKRYLVYHHLYSIKSLKCRDVLCNMLVWETLGSFS